MTSDASENLVLLRHLLTVGDLSESDQRAILDLRLDLRQVGPDQDIIREGDRPSRCCLLLEGVAFTWKLTGEGRRQIHAFHIAGDIPDLQSLHLRVLDSSIGTATSCKIGFIQHEHLHALCEQHPRVGSILWRVTLIDGAIFREWMTNVGQRLAYSRVAHLLAELFIRLQAVGLAKDDTCMMPISQVELADATGMSVVHVNRSVQALRANNLIRLERGTLQVLNWDGLAEAGDFDPTYLHLRAPAELPG